MSSENLHDTARAALTTVEDAVDSLWARVYRHEKEAASLRERLRIADAVHDAVMSFARQHENVGMEGRAVLGIVERAYRKAKEEGA